MKLSEYDVKIEVEGQALNEYDVRYEGKTATCFIASETGQVRWCIPTFKEYIFLSNVPCEEFYNTSGESTGFRRRGILLGLCRWRIVRLLLGP